MNGSLLRATPLLDFHHPAIRTLVQAYGWRDQPTEQRIQAVHHFVQDRVPFGYNRQDDLPASRVLSNGYGQCNTKAILLMALLRAAGLPCQLHGFTIHKELQRGILTGLAYRLAPPQILHSWVEVPLPGKTLTLEGFILDRAYLHRLQQAFPGQQAFCGYGAATLNLSDPPLDARRSDPFIQREGIERDLGVYDSPDEFYQYHHQFSGVQGTLYRHMVRHLMNRRLAAIRAGQLVPAFQGHRHD